jgi:[acyl-carrier-protein] S-malonyltransferase
MGKIGFLFAGQGTQRVGMARDLYDAFPESRAVFDKTEKILGFEFKRRCFEGPEGMLKMTNISQPAIVAAAIAAFEAFKKRFNLKPEYVAGLSLGEYSALIATQGLALEDGIRLINKRSQLLEDAARKYPSKTIEVLGLAEEKVKEICFLTQTKIAGNNSPGQTVISGAPEFIDKAAEACLKAGAQQVVTLDISSPLHTALMFEASVELKMFLDSLPFSELSEPVISNYTARPEYKVVMTRENLVYQMRFPVKWVESVRFILSQGVTKFIEFGSGKILKDLMRKIEPSAVVVNIETAEDILNFVDS